jgi:tetratricopeptide (TPR) repeat protein
MLDTLPTPPHRKFRMQFSIRRMLVAMTLSAIAIGLRVHEYVGVSWYAVVAVVTVVSLFADFGHYFLGHASEAFARGAYREAIRAYSQAIACNSRDPDRYCLRALAYERDGDHDAATKDYAKAIALDSRCWLAWTGRAHLHFSAGRFQEAIDDATVALCLGGQLGPQWTTNMLLVRGIAAVLLGQIDDAIEDLDAVVERGGNPWQALAYRGEARLVRRECEAALRDFEESLRGETKDNSAAVGRAKALFKLGRHVDALLQIDACLAEKPDHAEALSSKAWFLATCPNPMLRDGPKAMELARRADELNMGDGASLALAAAYAETGQFDEAIGHAQRAMACAPKCMRERIGQLLAACEFHQPFRDGP